MGTRDPGLGLPVRGLRRHQPVLRPERTQRSGRGAGLSDLGARQPPSGVGRAGACPPARRGRGGLSRTRDQGDGRRGDGACGNRTGRRRRSSAGRLRPRVVQRTPGGRTGGGRDAAHEAERRYVDWARVQSELDAVLASRSYRLGSIIGRSPDRAVRLSRRAVGKLQRHRAAIQPVYDGFMQSSERFGFVPGQGIDRPAGTGAIEQVVRLLPEAGTAPRRRAASRPRQTAGFVRSAPGARAPSARSRSGRASGTRRAAGGTRTAGRGSSPARDGSRDPHGRGRRSLSAGSELRHPGHRQTGIGGAERLGCRRHGRRGDPARRSAAARRLGPHVIARRQGRGEPGSNRWIRRPLPRSGTDDEPDPVRALAVRTSRGVGRYRPRLHPGHPPGHLSRRPGRTRSSTRPVCSNSPGSTVSGPTRPRRPRSASATSKSRPTPST